MYKIIANYRDDDPYNRGYWAAKRLCMRVKNFRLWMKPGDLHYLEQKIHDPKLVLAAACKISNKVRACALHANDTSSPNMCTSCRDLPVTVTHHPYSTGSPKLIADC